MSKNKKDMKSDEKSDADLDKTLSNLHKSKDYTHSPTSKKNQIRNLESENESLKSLVNVQDQVIVSQMETMENNENVVSWFIYTLSVVSMIFVLAFSIKKDKYAN